MSGSIDKRNARAAAMSSRDTSAFLAQALPRVYGYIALRVGNDRALAEDLTQETMMAYAAHLTDSDRLIVEPMAWLFAVARNKVVDHYRTIQRAVPTDAVDEHAFDSTTDGD